MFFVSRRDFTLKAEADGSKKTELLKIGGTLKNKKFILLCLFALFVVFFTVFFMVYVVSYEEEGEFTRIGSSEFYVTPQGKIYALVPSGGKFELKGVRADKFRVLAGETSELTKAPSTAAISL